MSRLRTIQDVVDWRLCLGCGACAYVCPDKKISLVNILEEGVRPVLKDSDCKDCRTCLDVCPGVAVDYRSHATRPGILPEAYTAYGPVLEIWEGHAADPEIRFRGSSGGALTALSLHCLEGEQMAGVLQIGQDPVDATRNSARLSRDRQALLACVGSRYAAASVCDQLGLVEQASGPCVVIGLPSEVAALRKVEALKPELAPKVGLIMSFFCAGAPSRKGTLALLEKLGVPVEGLEALRYRGYGWPGMFSTQNSGEESVREHMTYQQSWAFLQRFRPYSTHLFPDGSGEGADISCGDPWYRKVEPGEHGSSLIVARTERGREIVRRAIAAGHLVAKPASVRQMMDSQSNLTMKRGAIWGRLVAFRLCGAPIPRFQGFSLWRNWLSLSLAEKYKSLFGTLKRVLGRRYYRRAPSPRT